MNTTSDHFMKQVSDSVTMGAILQKADWRQLPNAMPDNMHMNSCSLILCYLIFLFALMDEPQMSLMLSNTYGDTAKN